MENFAASVRQAEIALRDLFEPTPLQKNDHLSARYGAEIWLKREDLTPVRSYKLRGAFNAMRKAVAAGGRHFVCASAGNHAQGMAYACRHFGVRGTIFMPVTTPRQKIDKTRIFGGDAIEIVLGQGAKPGGGGMLLGQKISERVAGMRTLPQGIDQRSACRHPDWTGPDDLAIKINELREITDWEKPIYVKVGATRTYYDVKLAVHSGADVVVVDGMQGGTAATQDVFIEHVGIPTLAAIPQAVQALQELGVHREVQLIVSGGIRNGADVAKAMALGADAVAIGTAALIALGDNDPRYAAEYEALGSAAGFYDDFQDGRDPAGISTQDPELSARFDPVLGGKRLANFLRVMTMEAQTIARACGKAHLQHLEPEDLVAISIEASAMARVPLAGTSWIPGAGL